MKTAEIEKIEVFKEIRLIAAIKDLHSPYNMRILIFRSSDLHLSSRLPRKTIRCPIAKHLPEDGTDIRTIQELPGHADALRQPSSG